LFLGGLVLTTEAAIVQEKEYKGNEFL